MNRHFQDAFQQAIKTGPIIFMHWFWDGDTNPVDFVSPNVEHIFGYTSEELIDGRTKLIDIFVEEDRQIFNTNLNNHIANSDTYWSASYQIYSKEKEVKYIRTYAYIPDRDVLSNQLSIYTYIIDETKLINQINEKQLLNTRYRVALESAGEGVWDWNYESNDIYLSDDLKSMLGYTNDEMKNQFSEWVGLIHPNDFPKVMDSLLKSIQERSIHYEMEYRMLHKDGTFRWILSRGKVVSSVGDLSLNRMIGTNVDITEQKNIESLLLKKNEELEILLSQIKELSITDPLTSLFNRRKIVEDLLELQKAAEEIDEQFAISIIDIDYFKRINDTYGHSIGDEVLRVFAHFIKTGVRKADSVGRWGGEEFLIIFPNTTLDHAYNVLSRLQENFVQSPVIIGEHLINLTFSAGISVSRPTQSVDEIITQADRALYIAKESGRNLIMKHDE